MPSAREPSRTVDHPAADTSDATRGHGPGPHRPVRRRGRKSAGRTPGVRGARGTRSRRDASHNAGSIEVLTGKTPAAADPTSTAKSDHPDFGMVAAKVRGLRADGLPQS